MKWKVSMKFDPSIHKSVIVIDQDLPAGLAINAVSVIGVSFGKLTTELVGPDLKSQDNVNYPGVVYSPLPILVSKSEVLHDIQKAMLDEEDCLVMPFSKLAQSCKTYNEYEERLLSTKAEDIMLAGIGLIGPMKKINKLTGNLPLFR
jgi:hypothetical protein